MGRRGDGKQVQERSVGLDHLELDRSAAIPLAEQVSRAIRAAIRDGRLKPGARLPSWRDLAVQLGVARGTIREAYERLTDDQLITASGPAGTHVSDHLPTMQAPHVAIAASLADAVAASRSRPLPFQMGIPAQDAFPAKLWSRIRIRNAPAETLSLTYPDPRGAPVLREQIAAYLAIARGIRCAPEQVLVTSGYRHGLDLVIRTLRVEGSEAWMEEPGFPFTRWALSLAGIRPLPVSVDEQGLNVEEGVSVSPNAQLAIVTAGQQAPLGMTLSPRRREALLRWAKKADAWIVEDDYLSELQLKGRAAPALASTDRAGRVIHLGTFSKTMSPSLGLGFLVAPPALAPRIADVAACLAPAPSIALQSAMAEFIRDGHYLRHLRRMKRLYAARRDALRKHLGASDHEEVMAGLAILRRLPDSVDDERIANEAEAHGIAPTALSLWYANQGSKRRGLLLGVTNLTDDELRPACESLSRVLSGHGVAD